MSAEVFWTALTAAIATVILILNWRQSASKEVVSGLERRIVRLEHALDDLEQENKELRKENNALIAERIQLVKAFQKDIGERDKHIVDLQNELNVVRDKVRKLEKKTGELDK